MKTIIKGAIAVLLILGVVKTFQDHDVQAEAVNYYNQAKNGELLQSIESVNFDSLKRLQFDDLIPSDFF
ncbi:hypothetical protein NGC64_01950 [Staphylococcus equorum]|uniref:hypothetical protein n=1 Tax=Staphylococcus equorum TaxID=246432 RepID=UPI002DB9D2DB|nr:hypothetical protein [Staphylococcus equorum]MEB7776740.1 hypothetical protein [Staphylococcus equorum]MEB7796656.1 hypothetical protein [Staphylococcus equorum]MEB7833680.1 hypothetical protein [Staphylococcus equorum]